MSGVYAMEFVEKEVLPCGKASQRETDQGSRRARDDGRQLRRLLRLEHGVVSPGALLHRVLTLSPGTFLFGPAVDPDVSGKLLVEEQRGRGRAEVVNGAGSKKGTPLTGLAVASPLLANLYLHWFDALFHGLAKDRHEGPDAKLVRYADDFGGGAGGNRWDRRPSSSSNRGWKSSSSWRSIGTRRAWWNYGKRGRAQDFSGMTSFRYDRDLKGRDQRYLNVLPSKKAVQRERAKLHEMTDSHQCFKPISTLIGELNRHLQGWAAYFSFGYPMSVYCAIDRYVQGRLIPHLQRRSQRPYQPPPGVSWSGHLAGLGLIRLVGLAHAWRREFSGEPDAEIRTSGSDEGEGSTLCGRFLSYSTGSENAILPSRDRKGVPMGLWPTMVIKTRLGGRLKSTIGARLQQSGHLRGQ